MLLEVEGTHIEKLPFKLDKFSELLSFEDSPVLLHMKGDTGTDYLMYWVDFSDGINRWLLWKVSRQELYYYLNSSLHLNEVVNSKENDFLFILNTTGELEITDGYLISRDKVPSSYLPDNDSFFQYDFPEEYQQYFSEYTYVENLRSHALYFTIKPKSPKYGETVSAKDAVDFLNNINKSYNEYSEFDFLATFKEQIVDEKKLKRTFAAIQDGNSLRVCDMSFSSFNVALCPDTLDRDPEIDKSLKDWRKQILDSYKNDVLDNDFNSEVDAEIIAEKFPDPEVRKKIFEPIIKIIESPNVDLRISDKTHKFSKQFKSIRKDSRDIIIEKPTIEELIEEKFPKRKIIQVFIEVPEDENIGDKSISKRELKQNLLFSEETNEFPIRLNSVSFGNTLFEFNRPLLLTAILQDGIYHLDFYILGIHVQSDDKDQLMNIFSREFFDAYQKIKDDPSNLHNEELNELVKSVRTIGEEDLPL